MTKYAQILAVTLTILITTIQHSTMAAWTGSSIGSGYSGMAIGDGRNDDNNRIYCGLYNSGIMIEHSWSSPAWTSYTVSPGIYSSARYNALDIGRMAPDSLSRLYVVRDQSQPYLYEYTHNGAAWVESRRTTFRFTGASVMHAARINGAIYDSLFIVGSAGVLYQVQMQANLLVHSSLPSAPAAIMDLCTGNGRSDGVVRLFGALQSGAICEWSHDGNAWTMSSTQTVGVGACNGVALGNARNDGTHRLYVGSTDNWLYEASYSNGAWAVLPVGFGGGAFSRLAIGNGRNDGTQRIYAACNDGNVYEFSRVGGGWSKQLIPAQVVSPSCLLVGNGRGDGLDRVYITGNGNVYEYTYSPDPPVTTPDFVRFENGAVTWQSEADAIYDVEWTYDLTTGEWYRDLSSLIGVVATDTNTTVHVPMFFRVRKRP